jgi:trimethylamine--corrinoid protein Co-methyltransferase
VIERGKLASGVDGAKGGKEKFVFSLGTVPISPLRFSQDGTVRLLKLAQEGIVTRIVSGVTSGATSPVSLAGTLTIKNAEIIAGICLVQIVNPGNPIIYGTFAGPMDMLRGKQILAAPESAILNAATAQLCRFYGIPFGYGTGGAADSAALDIQAGIEKTYTLLYTTLSGVDVIHLGIGGLLSKAMVSSYEQMLLDDEICNMVNRVLQGIAVSPETLALDLIAEVGHHGNYLSTEHTFCYFKNELFLPKFLDRRGFNERGEGELEVLERARLQAKEILATHRPKPFLPDVEEKMDQVLQGVLKNLIIEAPPLPNFS